MKKGLKILMTSALIIPLISVGKVEAVSSNIITNDDLGIPDKGLYEWGLKQYDSNGDKILTQSEINEGNNYEGLFLDMSNSDISSLKGIKYFDNGDIYFLDLSGNRKLTTLEGLEEVSTIKGGLNLTSCSLTSIEEVKKFKDLQGLMVEDNHLKSIPDLTSLSKLWDFGCPHANRGEGGSDFGYVCFHDNYLTEKELMAKLPSQVTSVPNWLKKESYSEDELYVSVSELNLSTDKLIYYDETEKNPGKYGEIVIALGRNNQEFDSNVINVESDNSSVVQVGSVISKNDEKLFTNLSGWEYSDDFNIYLKEQLNKINGSFTTVEEYFKYVKEYSQLIGFDGDGLGWGPLNGAAIIPRNPGTAYITISTPLQSKTIKVNVSNLTDKPIEEIPNDLINEFDNASNKDVEVNLSKSNVVKSEVFKASMNSKKNVTFNILDNNKMVYMWSFNGEKISKPDVDVDLNIAINKKHVDDIKNIVDNKNITVLNFAHHGKLPGTAELKIDLSDYYNDRNDLVLYYYNEVSGEIEKIDDNVSITNGYINLTIDHCSTYFLAEDEKTDVMIPDDEKPIDTNKPDVIEPDANDKSNVVNTSEESPLLIYTFGALISLIVLIQNFKQRKEY